MPIAQMWAWKPSILIGVVVFIGLYLAAIGPLRRRFESSTSVKRSQVVWFSLGSLTILLALISPLDELGDNYFFSAHMLQHALLVFVAPPMLMAGTPAWLVDALIRRRAIQPLARIVTHPVAAYLLFNLVFAGWHFPALYEAALENENIHIFEHLCFLVTAVLNWWPVLSPSRLLPRLPPLVQILYLFLDSIPCTVLGVVIVFQPGILYPTYAAAPALLGVSPLLDQQIAGLIMAMPAAMSYLVVISIVFFSWVNNEERRALKPSG